jgi:hypothetical protein
MELGPRISGTVTSPARIEEADKGHDIEYNTAKRVAYQYKRMDPKGPIERNIDGNPNEEWIKFGDDHTSDQVKTLLSNTFTLDTAFLTLPVIEYDAHLPEILDRTVFVDVFGLMIAAIRSPHSIDNFKTLYVSKDGLKSTKTKNNTPAVFWKHTDTNYLNSDAYHRVPSGFVRDWSEIQRRLVDCPLGMRTWESGEKLRFLKNTESI